MPGDAHDEGPEDVGLQRGEGVLGIEDKRFVFLELVRLATDIQAIALLQYSRRQTGYEKALPPLDSLDLDAADGRGTSAGTRLVPGRTRLGRLET